MEIIVIKIFDGWVFNGSKIWIFNVLVVDLFVIWVWVVENGEKGKVWGFLVEKGIFGFFVFVIKNKMFFWVFIIGFIFMEDVKFFDVVFLLKFNGLGLLFFCLNNVRYGISWGVMGVLEDCIVWVRDYVFEW